MRDGYNTSPFNVLPPVAWLLILPIVAVEVVIGLGQIGLAGGAQAVGWRAEALSRFALSPRMLGALTAQGVYPPAEMARFVTYGFVHATFTQALFAAVITLAMAKFVGEVFRGWAVAAVFLVSAIIGGLAYSMVPDIRLALYGAFPGAYGLIGAFTYVLWTRLGGAGGDGSRYRAFSLIGVLMGIQLVFGLLFGGGFGWVADLAGFATGFVLSIVVAPGGWRTIVGRLRQR